MRIKRRKKEAEIAGNEGCMGIGESEEEWEKDLDELEKYKQNKKEERDNKMLELHEVELPEDAEKERTK